MPSPVQRASFGGGSVPPPEPPQGATATIAKTPFFSVANAFERTDRAMDFFCEIAGEKITVPRLIPARVSASSTAFPTPSQFPQLGRGGSPAKNRRHFWPLWATPAEGRRSLAAAAIAVPLSIDTGTPAPAVRLPLDPLPAHRNRTPFAQESGSDLIFTRGRHRRDIWLPSNSMVCHRRRPRPQLPT